MNKSIKLIFVLLCTAGVLVSCSEQHAPTAPPVTTVDDVDFSQLKEFSVFVYGDISYYFGSAEVDDSFLLTNIQVHKREDIHNYDWVLRNYALDAPIQRIDEFTYGHDTTIVRGGDLWFKETTLVQLSADRTILRRLYQRLEYWQGDTNNGAHRTVQAIELADIPLSGKWDKYGRTSAFLRAKQHAKIRQFVDYDISVYNEAAPRQSVIVHENPRIDSGFVEIGLEFGK